MRAYKHGARMRAIQRGLAFIYEVACTPAHFADYGSDLLNCFHLISATSLDEELRRTARRMGREPQREPPPVDVPDVCEGCGRWRARGRKRCCRRPLAMLSRYAVWYDALNCLHTAERYGIELGACYEDVLKWLPTLRPYRGRA